MHRIDAADHVANLFVDRDVGGGIPGTVIDASWLNDVQEELCNLVEDAGLTLVEGTQTQIQAAINAYAWVFTGLTSLRINGTLSTPDTPNLQLMGGATQFKLYFQDTRGATGNEVGRIVYDGGQDSGGTGNEAHPAWVFQECNDAGVFVSNGVRIYNGTNPASTVPFTNTLAVSSLVKCSGSVLADGGGNVVVNGGFNLASVGFSGGNEIRVNIADDMADANYAVVVTVSDGTDRVPRVLNKAAGLFDVQFYDLSAAGLIVPTVDAVQFDFIIVGAQP